MSKENQTKNKNKNKNNNKDKKEDEIIHGTCKCLSFYIIDPKKPMSLEYTSLVKNVNFEMKILHVIQYWIRLCDMTYKMNNDVIGLMKSFVVGSDKYIKNENDKFVIDRYKYIVKKRMVRVSSTPS